MKRNLKLGSYYLYTPPFVGGFCKVYKAIRLDRPQKFYAIKMPLDQTNPEQIKALHREAKVLSKVRHPNIIKLLEKYLDYDPPYIVLEYLSGGSLERNVGCISYEEAIYILYRISSALGVFHQKGGFHRDIKPANILISNDGDVVLADVNIANIPSTGSSFTRSICGTPGYIDPWVVNRQYDWRADIFSLGVTITELITGVSPGSIINNAGLAIQMSDLPIENDNHRKAFYRLIKAMVSTNRNLRPNTQTIHHYALSLLNGGLLPRLPAVIKQKKPPTEPISIGGILVAGAFMVLLFIGIAALSGKK